jgi:hypothetical protein
MDHDPAMADFDDGAPAEAYVPPTFEVISLDCEITAYAPDDDLPLF